MECELEEAGCEMEEEYCRYCKTAVNSMVLHWGVKHGGIERAKAKFSGNQLLPVDFVIQGVPRNLTVGEFFHILNILDFDNFLQFILLINYYFIYFTLKSILL